MNTTQSILINSIIEKSTKDYFATSIFTHISPLFILQNPHVLMLLLSYIPTLMKKCASADIVPLIDTSLSSHHSKLIQTALSSIPQLLNTLDSENIQKLLLKTIAILEKSESMLKIQVLTCLQSIFKFMSPVTILNFQC